MLSATTKKITPARPKAVHGVWSSRSAFLLATVGSVVWLNNLYQLPYLASQYGGGAFLFVYVLGIVLVGLPLVVMELLLGQEGRASAPTALLALVRQARANRNWALLAWAAVAAGFLIFAYYSVIGGWALAHAFRALVGAHTGLTEDGVASLFSAFLRDPEKQLFWHALFLVLTMAVSARGLHKGIEPLMRFLVPAIFALLVLLAIYAFTLVSFRPGVAAFLAPDFTQLSVEGVLMAFGHAFFGLSLGMGVLMAYGARLPRDAPVVRLSLMVVAADLVAVVLAGLVLFPVLSAGGLAPPSGLATIFQAMPVAFDLLPAGAFMRWAFFVLIVLIVWTSAVSFVEPIMLVAVERYGMSRERAAVALGFVAWLVGLVVILSFNYWAFEFSFFAGAKSLGFFDVLLIATNMALPIISALMAGFVGWKLARLFPVARLKARSLCTHDAWIWSLRLIVPAVLIIILVNLPRLFL